jgi:hypothetical protein
VLKLVKQLGEEQQNKDWQNNDDRKENRSNLKMYNIKKHPFERGMFL